MSVSQAEYLKKYMSNGAKVKKSKKKKKNSAPGKVGIRILDDAIDLKSLPEGDGFDNEEDKPTVAEVYYEDIKLSDEKDLRAYPNKWKRLASDDQDTSKERDNTGQPDNSVIGKLRDKALNVSPSATLDSSRRTQNSPSPILQRNRHYSSDSSSPPSRENSKGSYSQTKRQQESYSPSPTKKRQEGYDSSRSRKRDDDKSRHRKQVDSSDYNSTCHSSPHRRNRDKNSSPLTERKNSPYHSSHKKKQNKRDYTPERKRKENLTSSRPQNTPNFSPPRKRRSDTSDRSPPRRRHQDSPVLSPSRKRRKDTSDLSPPRKKRRDIPDFSPPRRRQNSPDFSPPRRKRQDSPDLSPPGRKREDSPPRRKRQNSPDLSPPRRKRRNSPDLSPPRRKRQDFLDLSPPRRKRQDSPDLSPPRRKRQDSPDLSPPRRKRQDSPDIFSQRKISHSCRDHSPVNKNNDREHHEADVTDGKRKISTQEFLRNRKRGKTGKETEEEKARKIREAALQEKIDEQHAKWNHGVTQLQNYQQKLSDDAHEMTKSIARYSDDADMNAQLKDRLLEEDPMLAYIQSKRKVVSNAPQYPIYKGSFLPNRFGIRPGYRWDGCSRSNGYEKSYFDAISSDKAAHEEAYKWSIEEM